MKSRIFILLFIFCYVLSFAQTTADIGISLGAGTNFPYLRYEDQKYVLKPAIDLNLYIETTNRRVNIGTAFRLMHYNLETEWRNARYFVFDSTGVSTVIGIEDKIINRSIGSLGFKLYTTAGIKKIRFKVAIFPILEFYRNTHISAIGINTMSEPYTRDFEYTNILNVELELGASLVIRYHLSDKMYLRLSANQLGLRKNYGINSAMFLAGVGFRFIELGGVDK